MCLAIYKPKEIILTKKILRSGFRNNPDGAGIAYPDKEGKKLVVKRGFFHFREFWKAVRDLQKDKPMLIHFRIATSGKVDESNCHPWLIDDRHALIHNGNIEKKLNEKDDQTSDTGLFVSRILQPIFATSKFKRNRFWSGAPFKWLMEETIGINNKIVILDNTGFATIYNESQGEWEHGAWFSNKTYKEDRKSIKGATTTLEHRNGTVVEVTKYANGKTVYNYLTKSEAAEKQKTHLELGNEFQNELRKHQIIDIGELY